MIEDNFPVAPKQASTQDPQYAAGSTHWFEGDITFQDEVRRLQAEGLVGVSPYTLPLPYLSVSQVEQYLRCGQQYYRRYVKGEKKPPGIALVQGTSVHKALELGYGHVIAQKNLPELDFILDSYSTELDRNLSGEVVWDEKDEDTGEETAASDPGMLKDQGVKLLKIWHVSKLPTVHPQSAEKSFITVLGGVPVVGKVDLIDRVEKPLDPAAMEDVKMHPLLDAVVDHKVLGKAMPKSRADASLQMSLYCHTTGLPTARYDMYCKTKVPKIQELLTSRNPQQVRWAIRIFVEAAKSISQGSFGPCSPDNFLCSPRFCGFWDTCRGAA